MSNKLIFALAVVACALATGCATNPITGKSEMMFFPEKDDIELGNKYAPELEVQMRGRIPDQTLQNYITRVGMSCANVSHSPDWEYEFIAVQDPMINAFALPGGKIFITRGMLDKLSSEAQLASILAHETAHVVARDTSSAMSRQIGLNLLLTAGAAVSGAEGAGTLAQLTSQIINLKYSRTDEEQADLAGLEYMTKAGYNPYGIVETMEILESLGSGDRPPEFLSTHPSPENRIGYLTNRIQTLYSNLPARKVGREDYQKNVVEPLKRIPLPPEEEPKKTS